CSIVFLFFFFFQAEDGIRDGHVTGVQTCALPIFRAYQRDFFRRFHIVVRPADDGSRRCPKSAKKIALISSDLPRENSATKATTKIGRASCRERGRQREQQENKKKKQEKQRKE